MQPGRIGPEPVHAGPRSRRVGSGQPGAPPRAGSPADTALGHQRRHRRSAPRPTPARRPGSPPSTRSGCDCWRHTADPRPTPPAGVTAPTPAPGGRLTGLWARSEPPLPQADGTERATSGARRQATRTGRGPTAPVHPGVPDIPRPPARRPRRAAQTAAHDHADLSPYRRCRDRQILSDDQAGSARGVRHERRPTRSTGKAARRPGVRSAPALSGVPRKSRTLCGPLPALPPWQVSGAVKRLFQWHIRPASVHRSRTGEPGCLPEALRIHAPVRE